MTHPLSLDNELWRYSLAVYAYEPLQQWLLDMQNQWGANVNLLLCHGWLCRAGKGLPLSQWHHLADRLAPWSNLTDQLRQQRVKLKQAATNNSDARRLRGQVARAELLSEQHQQALMYQYCQRHGQVLAADWPQWLAAFGWLGGDRAEPLFARAEQRPL